ncbi:MAG: ParB N-terminal domain-containing protein [Desulfobacterales bacterium]|nr:ParB N-terminal domain-containing protein [Desulfobacterales bacterium]
MFEKEQFISIEKIDLMDKTYRISTDNNISNLLESIQTNGLISPAIVKKEYDRFIIISGYKRILAINEIGSNKTLVKIVKEKETREETDFFCAKLSIIENAFYRELNLIEQAKGVSLLKKSLSIEEISLNSLFFFNTNLNTKFLGKLLKIKSMGNSIHKLILSKKLSMNNAILIKDYEPQILNAFINIFQKLRMGQNKQSEIIVNFHEIALRDDIPLLELINSSNVSEIIDHENPDENYKANLLRLYLSKKRYPELTKAYEEHKKCIKEFKLEPEIKLDPPINFEGEKYSLSFEFKNIKEFEKHVEKLIFIQKNNTFKNLFK